MRIRDAASGDAAAIAEIYNDAVANTTAIWNDQVVTDENRRGWLADRQASGFPVLVAVTDADEVLGYSSFAGWRAFDGFRATVEHSVYVRAGRRGAGVGRALLDALIARARYDGLHVMVAAIEAGNAASIRLHERLGFRTVGTVHQAGMKFGRWLDLAFMQLTLDDRETP